MLSRPNGATLLEARAEKSQGFQITTISSQGTVCACHFSSTYFLHLLHLISLWSFGLPLISNSLHILHQLLLLVVCQNGKLLWTLDHPLYVVTVSEAGSLMLVLETIIAALSDHSTNCLPSGRSWDLKCLKWTETKEYEYQVVQDPRKSAHV